MSTPDPTKGNTEQPPNHQGGERLLPLAALIAAATALVTGVTGLAVTGTAGRAQRNHPELFALAIALIVVAAGCWTLAALAARKKKWDGPKALRPFVFWEWTAKPYFILGTLLSIGAVVLGFAVAISTVGEAERPAVVVSLDARTLTVTGTVTVDHLASDEAMDIVVEGVRSGTTAGVVTIAAATVGPDSDGNINHPITTRVPEGRYDAVRIRAELDINDDASSEEACAASTSGASTTPDGTEQSSSGMPNRDDAEPAPAAAESTACVLVPLPSRTRLPQVRLVRRRARAVVFGLSTSVNTPPAGTVLRFDVSGRRRGRSTVSLLRSRTVPGSHGSARVRVTAPRRIVRICARAGFVKPGDNTGAGRCPVKSGGAVLEVRAGPGR